MTSANSLRGEEETDTAVAQGSQLIDLILRRRPICEIKELIKAGAPVWYQDDEGTSPLHAAAYLEDEELVRFLIDEGAVWNAEDSLHHTAGDIALSLNNEQCYTVVRDAGIRSELVLRLLEKHRPATNTMSLILKANDDSAAGSTDTFLNTKLEYTKDDHGQDICLVKINDTEEVGVMMGWERSIMQETVHSLCSDHLNLSDGLKVLNVGFGLGIIDSLFQDLQPKPAVHVIIEPHPDVLEYMRKQGWYEKEGVKILEGKWQDYVDSDDLLGFGGFDVIYTDTFSEDYSELHRFFGHVPDLFADAESRFSFFNGLGATNATFYDVYRHVSDLHLDEVGLNVEWSDVDVYEGDVDRWGKTREYFSMRTYRLPVAMMKMR